VALDFLTPTDFKAGPEPAKHGELPAGEERRVGDYELIEELGRGGMGVVYRARQLSLGREVAVKFLLHGVLAGDQAIARFRAEAEAAASLRHPHVVAIHEIGEDRGRHFQAMELVRGRSLAEALRDGPLPAARAARYVRSVAEALQYAHERGVLHRDLKPANVLIDEHDEPRVTDFGLAKRVESRNESGVEGADDGTKSSGPPLSTQPSLNPPLTLTGQVLGTPAYISPEQADGRPVDARSDVYSLGALLYHLVAGRPPFTGESATHVLRQVAETEPVALRLLNPSLPGDLETICLKSLEKEPARRYPTAKELAEELHRWLRDEPIRARPVSPAERAWRWCKRRPALAGSLAGIALLLVGITVVSHQAARRIEVLRLGALTNLYASDMRLAQQAIAESKFGAATELLERHRPRPGDPDLRGFEWWHFQEHCRSEEAAALEGHGAQVQRAAFSPDGRWVATTSGDVQVWETATRRRLMRFQTGNFVWALAFSPDSSTLLAGNANNEVFRFDMTASARSLESTTGGSVSESRPAGVLTNLPSLPIAFFWPDPEAERRFPNLAARGAIERADAEAGATPARRQPGIRIVSHDALLAWDGTNTSPQRLARFENTLSRAQVTRDGRRAAALSGARRIGLWSLEPPGLVQEFSLPEPARAAAISPDGARLAAGDYSGTLRIWELAAAGRSNVVAAHRGLIESAVFSPDGARLASAGADQIIRVHDAGTGARLGEWQGHRATIMALAFSPDGRWLVSGDKRGDVKLWSLQGHTRSDVAVIPGLTALSADGAQVATWNNPTSITLRASSALAETGLTRSTPGNSSLLCSARTVAVIDAEGKLRTLEADGSWREHPLGGLSARPGGALSPDGRFVALKVNGVEGLLVWDLMTGREVFRVTNEPTWIASTFSADSRQLACTSHRGQARVWELPSGRELASFRAHGNWAYDCDLSRDGTRLVTASFDGSVKLWDVASARLLGEYRSTADAYWTVALSPDGRRIAAGTSESSIVLWDVPSRQEVASFALGEPLRPVEGRLRFTPDGHALLRANRVLNHWAAPAR
jgi:serine/threonine protein kinase/WD40 repeat protein